MVPERVRAKGSPEIFGSLAFMAILSDLRSPPGGWVEGGCWRLRASRGINPAGLGPSVAGGTFLHDTLSPGASHGIGRRWEPRAVRVDEWQRPEFSEFV